MISELLPGSFKFVVIELVELILNEYKIEDFDIPERKQLIYNKILVNVKLFFNLFIELNDINYIYKQLQILNDLHLLISMISTELYCGISSIMIFKKNQISLSYDYNHMELLIYINSFQKQNQNHQTPLNQFLQLSHH